MLVKCLLDVVPAQSARKVHNRKRPDPSADDADKEFPRVMFLMHQWFMSPRALAELFMDLYLFWLLASNNLYSYANLCASLKELI